MLENIDINKTVASNQVSFGKEDFKCFIGYKDGKQMRALCTFLPKLSAFRRDFDKTKCMSFYIQD